MVLSESTRVPISLSFTPFCCGVLVSVRSYIVLHLPLEIPQTLWTSKLKQLLGFKSKPVTGLSFSFSFSSV